MNLEQRLRVLEKKLGLKEATFPTVRTKIEDVLYELNNLENEIRKDSYLTKQQKDEALLKVNGSRQGCYDLKKLFYSFEKSL